MQLTTNHFHLDLRLFVVLFVVLVVVLVCVAFVAEQGNQAKWELPYRAHQPAHRGPAGRRSGA